MWLQQRLKGLPEVATKKKEEAVKVSAGVAAAGVEEGAATRPGE